MRRDNRGSLAYWNKWISFMDDSIAERWKRLEEPSGDPNYRPQYISDLSKKYYELMLQRYSRGDEVTDLSKHFEGLLDAWEAAEKLGRDVWNNDIQFTRHSWTVNLDHYIRCFWLTGLALSLNIPDAQWQRLVALMGNEGRDALLDRVIATRQPERKIGESLCFSKPYKRLLAVVEAPSDQRAEKLRGYLDYWFVDLKNSGSLSFPPAHRTPYWWNFCANEELGMKGAYFGCWCIEAVAVAKAFGIDDSLCLDHPNYPGDLIEDNRCPRYPDDTAASEPAVSPLSPKKGLLARLFGKAFSVVAMALPLMAVLAFDRAYAQEDPWQVLSEDDSFAVNAVAMKRTE